MANTTLKRTTHTHYAIALAVLLALTPVIVRAAVELARFEGRWENDRVVLEWETGSEINHAGFNLYRHTQDLPPGQVPALAIRLNDTIIYKDTACTTSGNTYYFEDTTADPAQAEYHYWLESINCTGGSEIDPDAHIVVPVGSGNPVPAPPATLTTAGLSDSGAIRVLWSAVAGADAYRIERRSGAGDWSEIGSVNSSQLSFDDTTATCSVNWQYRVRALAGGLASDPSPTASQLAPPCAPNSVRASRLGSAAHLTWIDATPDETGYRIERRQLGSWTLLTDSVPANSTSFDDISLPCGVTVRYRIRALRSTDNLMSPWRETGAVESPACTPTITPTRTPRPSPTVTPVQPSATATSAGTSGTAPTATPVPTRTPTPSRVPTKTRTPTRTPRLTRTPRPTSTSAGVPSAPVAASATPQPTEAQPAQANTSRPQPMSASPTLSPSASTPAPMPMTQPEPASAGSGQPPHPTDTPQTAALAPVAPAASSTAVVLAARQTVPAVAGPEQSAIPSQGTSGGISEWLAGQKSRLVGGAFALVTLLIAGWLYTAMQRSGDQ